MSQDKVDSQDNELGADSPASKPLKKTRRTYTAESVALDHGVTVEQVLEANGNPKKTKGSHFVNKGKVDRILNAAKLAESEAKAEDDKPEPDAKTLLNAEFFEGEPAPPSNDTWAEQEDGDSDSHTSIEVEASTVAARLRIKLKQLLKLFGIEFDPQNDEANGLKMVDEAEAERLLQEACEYAAAVMAEAKAEARAAAEARAEADAEARAEAQSVEVETEEEVEAIAEAETKVEVEAKDEQTPVPYIVSSTQVDEPEETPEKETAPEGIFDFSDEFTQSYIDRAQAFIKLIECEA